MKKWHQLTTEEKRKVSIEWLNSEGYDDQGNEYDSPEEYYKGINKISLVSDEEKEILATETGIMTGAS